MTGTLAGLRLEPSDALFLDLDGTLAEIIAEPDDVHLPEATADALGRIAVRLGGALAILSGRDLRDLVDRTPPGLWRLGGHGLEVLPPHSLPPPAPPLLPEAVLAPLRAMAARPGVRLELKGALAALHYRAALDSEVDCRAAAQSAAADGDGLVWQAGKMVVEVKPASAHKGRALRALIVHPPFAGRRPVMVGDDTTDEDAIAAAEDLGGVGVKVGDGPSAASFRAPDPAAVRAWLDGEAARP